MPPRWTRWLDAMTRLALRVGSRELDPARREEVIATVRHACLEARQRGWMACCATAAGELADVATVNLRSRFGTGLRISDGSARSIPGTRMSWIWARDIRRAFTRLRSSPATLLLSIAMLACAIGVTTAMFTVVDALVLRPVPFRDPSTLTGVVVAVNGARGYMPTVSPALFRAWKQSSAFEQVEAAIQSPIVVESGGELTTKGAARITPGLLRMLGVQPIRGRAFVDGEGRNGTDDRILLSAEIWRSLFNSDPHIVGRRIRVSGVSMEVIGILPGGFRFPYARVAAWMPVDLEAPPSSLEQPRVIAFARLARGVPSADALKAADAAARGNGSLAADRQTWFRPIAAGMVDQYSRRGVQALSLGVALVFVVLCLNAMNLMLTRLTARQREFGVCSALGASRVQLLRQALAETVMIGLAAGAVGLFIADALVGIATTSLPAMFLSSTLTPIEVSTRAVAATSILALLAAAIAGVTPAWLATRVDAAESLRTIARGATESKPRRRLARALLVGQVALATTLLVGAALMVRTFINLMKEDRGLNAEGVITGWISLPEFSFKDRPSRLAFASALEDRLKTLTGVQQASLSGGVPPSTGNIYFGDLRTLDGQSRTVTMDELNMYNVSPAFFHLFGIQLVSGRTFSEPAASDEVIVGARFARLLWPDGAAVGRTFAFEGSKTPNRVIGVVNEIRNPTLDPRVDRPEIYFPLVVERNGRVEASAFGSGQIFVALKCAATCPELPQIRQVVRSVNPQVVIASLGPMEEAYAKNLSRPRASAALAAAFAVIALLSSAAGLFGVLSAAVAARRHEFGIRVALGIDPARLRGVVMADAARLALTGFAVGTLGAWALGRSLASVTHEAAATDMSAWITVCASLAIALALAAWRPASQAARVDPVALLREE